MGFIPGMQGWFDILKLMRSIPLIDRTSQKKNLTNPTTIHDKISQLTRNGGELSQLDKEYLQKATANTILKGEKLQAFPSRLGKNIRMSSLFLFLPLIFLLAVVITVS